MIFDKLLSRRSVPAERPHAPEIQMLGRPQAGITVTETSALNYAAVYACVKVISETLAVLPWNVMFQDGDSRHAATDHAVHSLLKRRPNPEMEPSVYKTVAMAHVLLWGAHYAEIEFNGLGEPVALWPLDPSRVTPDRDGRNQLIYKYTDDSGKEVVLSAKRAFRVLGLTLDGITPCSVIKYARETISAGLAAESYGSSFFGNGAIPGGYIKGSAESKLSENAIKNLLDSWNRKLRGPKNAKKVQYLDLGMEYVPIGIPPEDAQFLETRKFQVIEVCRWFRCPPHKIGELENAHHTNIEQQNLEFITDTMMFWVVRFEEAANFKLIDEPDHFSKFNVNALLRGDMQARSDFYQKMFDRGSFDIDEIRAMEDMNPLPNGMGKLRLVPLNYTTVESAMRNGGTGKETMKIEQLWADPSQRMVRKESKALARMLAKGITQDELEEFYARHEQHIIESFTPIAAFCQVKDTHLRAKKYCDLARADLDAVETDIADFESYWMARQTRKLCSIMRGNDV